MEKVFYPITLGSILVEGKRMEKEGNGWKLWFSLRKFSSQV